jgi:Coenzyme PQQ synthesis protein D (PqqD)
MKLFERKKILQGVNYLELRPVRRMREEVDSENNVTVIIPKFTSRFAKKYFQPMLKYPEIRLNLDPLGSASWLSIDGVKNVETIAGELTLRFGDKVQPVEERLTKFLTQLFEQRLITFEELKGE